MNVVRVDHKCKIPVCNGVYCIECGMYSKVEYKVNVAGKEVALCPHCTRKLAAAIHGELL